MRAPILTLALALVLASSGIVRADQAGDTTITIVGNSPGVTPFIAQLTLNVSDPSVLASIQFSVTPKAGSVTRPFSQTFSTSYLATRDYLDPATGVVFLPVYGLYSNFANQIKLTYRFLDGSSKQATTTITAPVFTDPCSINHPTVLQARSDTTELSYDYMLVRGNCGGMNGVSPVILDTDGNVRWTSPLSQDTVRTSASTYFDNAIYVTRGSLLYRVELDGTVTELKDYSDMGVVNFHHNIDQGRTGLILEVDDTDFIETANIEVDGAGNVLETWNPAAILGDVMTAGGDNPSDFIAPTPDDWWHNNATTYRKSDNTLLISSRENLVMAVNYDDDTLRWLLGDKSKRWFQFQSLQPFALAVAVGTHPPIGQHALSITADDHLLLFDNGLGSTFHTPAGVSRTYSSPRKYRLNLTANLATEVWNYEREQTIYSQVCSSVYEDAPLNYLIDYAFISTQGPDILAELTGLTAAGEMVFQYRYPGNGCGTAYNSTPLHAEQFSLTNAGQNLNISTRGNVMGGANFMVAGFIVTGSESKDLILRALGPSLADAGVTGALSDPVLTIYDSTGAIVAVNDNWAADAGAGEISAQHLAPTSDSEAATVQRLSPGIYTVAVSGKAGATGVALVEVYDLSRNSNSTLSNISTRGFVGTGDDVLISGFIVGARNDETAVIRAIGPSLADAGVAEALGNPLLQVYDSNGTILATNDDWMSDPGANQIEAVGLAPTNTLEAATILTLTPGSYTAVVRGAEGSSGVGLVEVYNLP